MLVYFAYSHDTYLFSPGSLAVSLMLCKLRAHLMHILYQVEHGAYFPSYSQRSLPVEHLDSGCQYSIY